MNSNSQKLILARFLIRPILDPKFPLMEGIDYEETFSPTAKWATIRTLLSLAAQKGWKVHQMDVKTAFLNGDLKENVFMSQPEGFFVKGKNKRYASLSNPCMA